MLKGQNGHHNEADEEPSLSPPALHSRVVQTDVKALGARDLPLYGIDIAPVISPGLDYPHLRIDGQGTERGLPPILRFNPPFTI